MICLSLYLSIHLSSYHRARCKVGNLFMVVKYLLLWKMLAQTRDAVSFPPGTNNNNLKNIPHRKLQQASFADKEESEGNALFVRGFSLLFFISHCLSVLCLNFWLYQTVIFSPLTWKTRTYLTEGSSRKLKYSYLSNWMPSSSARQGKRNSSAVGGIFHSALLVIKPCLFDIQLLALYYMTFRM